jgi:hypothetical protein
MNWAQDRVRAMRARGLREERCYVSEIDGTKLGIVVSVAWFLYRERVERGSWDEFLVWKSIPFNAIGREIHVD